MAVTRETIERELAALERALQDSLARLHDAGQRGLIGGLRYAPRASFWRSVFDRDVRDLRRELDSPAPDIHLIAFRALQVAQIAHIWPILHAVWALQAPQDATAALKRRTDDRLKEIRKIMAQGTRTPPAIAARYNKAVPVDPLTARTVRKLLRSIKK